MDASFGLAQGIVALLRLPWRIFMEVEVPGLGVSFGVFWIGVVFIGFSIRVLSTMLGTHVFIPSAPESPPVSSYWFAPTQTRYHWDNNARMYRAGK